MDMFDDVRHAAVDNGVNVEALIAARQALSETPQAAQFRWRATCTWMNGTHSRSSVDGFFGSGVSSLTSKG